MPKTAEEDKSAALWYTLAGRVAFYFYGIILPALVFAGRGSAWWGRVVANAAPPVRHRAVSRCIS